MIMTPPRGLGRALMMREACNNGELVPRSEMGQVRAIDPTRCARRKVLAPTGDEQGWQGKLTSSPPKHVSVPSLVWRWSSCVLRRYLVCSLDSRITQESTAHWFWILTVRSFRLHAHIGIDSLTLWVEKKSFEKLGV